MKPNPKRKNALFSFHPGMLSGHARRVPRLKRIAWDRLSREKRRRVAIAAGVSERIAHVWAKILWRDIPEGWKGALLTNLGAARNPMKKTRRKKKKATKKVARRRTRTARNTRTRRTTRKKKNSRARRSRTVTFPLRVTPAQKKQVQRFLSNLTGRRVTMK